MMQGKHHLVQVLRRHFVRRDDTHCPLLSVDLHCHVQPLRHLLQRRSSPIQHILDLAVRPLQQLGRLPLFVWHETQPQTFPVLARCGSQQIVALPSNHKESLQRVRGHGTPGNVIIKSLKHKSQALLISIRLAGVASGSDQSEHHAFAQDVENRLNKLRVFDALVVAVDSPVAVHCHHPQTRHHRRHLRNVQDMSQIGKARLDVQACRQLVHGIIPLESFYQVQWGVHNSHLGYLLLEPILVWIANEFFHQLLQLCERLFESLPLHEIVAQEINQHVVLLGVTLSR
mmetsp:Transcript_12439/g.23611  ORF Transcript_12439/g.23611 Transcript_12439/m.23611 type:complete len:286 (-) Transcript_12439:177-1034(-)